MTAPRPTTSRAALAELAALLGVAVPSSGESVVLTGVSLDSRSVAPGDLYAALPGEHTHGARYAAQAADLGAVAILTDAAGAELAAGTALPLLVVPDPRGVLGALSARVHGTDRRVPRLVGVTGTNGKTTTAYLISCALEALGHRTGLVGTVETRVGAERVSSTRTTPEAPDLHALLAVMVERDLDTCVMEVSSHALALHRVDGVTYDLALFTNLSQDHLEFHGTLEEYFAAKADLFTARRSRLGLVCVDDDWGARLAASCEVPVVTLASRPGVSADWVAVPDRDDPGAFRLTGPAGTLDLRSALPGDFNVTNTAMAAVALLLLGEDLAATARAVLTDPHVPGRMERVTPSRPHAKAPLAVVDYAHTPDAVAAALSALRPGTPGALVAVVGAGGDRDPGKRAAMGAAAAGTADVVVVTDDNPRSEEPAAIRAAVLAGTSGHPARVLEVADRHAAIRAAVLAAVNGGPGSCVAVLGKGHETGQDVAGVRHPFDDRVELRAALDETLGVGP